MLRVLRFLVLAVMACGLAGCPLFGNNPRTFTSADPGGGGFFGDIAETADGGEGGAANDAGGERVVVEPDVIRRDGNLLYVLNQFRGLSIVDLDSETLLVQVPAMGVPRDLYFHGNELYVLVGGVRTVAAADESFSSSNVSRVYSVDIADPENAAIQSELELDGSLVDSRLVGDVLYVVTTTHDYGYGLATGPEIAYTNDAGTTAVISIDVATVGALDVADRVSFTGSGHVIHVNSEAAFIAANDWQQNRTAITYLDITDPSGAIREVGAMDVRGFVGDRFKLDAWNGALRVVSSDWEGGNQVYLSTFDLTDPALTKLAEQRIEGAEGETLFATRFDGARAYIVTYLVVDPLFVLDVSDPANPVQLGALEVPGYSTHIEARGDRLITLGVDDTDGRQVNVSIFDVSGNGAPALLDRVRFGENWSWSSAYEDVKALTILDDVIIVPFSGWNGDRGGFDRLQFISYGADTLQLRGAVDLRGNILRSFDYGADYYGVTTEQLSRIEASDLDNPSVVSSVTLAEDLVDFLPVSNGLFVELVAQQDEGNILLRTVDGADTVLGALTLEYGYYQNAFVHNETVAVVGIVWNGVAGYVVHLVDISAPGAPVLRDTLTITVDPFYAYYGFDIYGGGGFPEDGVAASKDAIGYPYYYGGGEESAFLAGDILALRCLGESFDRTIGDAAADQGLAVVDLEEGRWTETVGLGYDRIVSVNERSDRLYLSSQDAVGLQVFNPMTAYYVQELDLAGGVEGPRVNVPGAFLDYDPDNDILTLRDHQWRPNGNVETTLETVRWTGDELVEPVDSLALPEYSYNHRASNGRVYFEGYDNGALLYQARVGNSGGVSLGDPVRYGASYGYLIGVTGDHAIVSIGSATLAHYTFDNGTGALTQQVEVTGYPSTIRVTPDAIYMPLGYYGLVTLPL